MSFFSRQLRRYAVYLWACLLSCVFVLSPTIPASAQTTVTWEDLQAQSTHLRNPYEHLTTTQTYQLSDLYQLREWIKVNQPEPESFERQELQRLEELFTAEGIDTYELLKEADEAKAYWAAQSRVTNTD
ncbi:MAG: transporter, partial [Cyanobacteria bacterium J06554_3]